MVRKAIVLILLSLPVLASAAAGNIIVKITPENPGPNQEATIDVTSYNLDLDRSLITWKVNGAPVSSGVGQKTLKIVLGNLGSKSMVEITASGADNTVFKSNLLLRPTDLKLVWQATTKTPVWYRGKSLAGPDSRVQVIADPDFIGDSGPIGDQNLVYQWQIDDNNVSSQSGTAKNILLTTTPDLGVTKKISVRVSNLDNTLVAKKDILLTAATPKVIIYPYHPLTGPGYHQLAPTTIGLTDEEITLWGQIFNLTQATDGPENYLWKINNRPVQGTSIDGRSLTLRKPADTTGEALISLEPGLANNHVDYTNRFIKIIFNN